MYLSVQLWRATGKETPRTGHQEEDHDESYSTNIQTGIKSETWEEGSGRGFGLQLDSESLAYLPHCQMQKGDGGKSKKEQKLKTSRWQRPRTCMMFFKCLRWGELPISRGRLPQRCERNWSFSRWIESYLDWDECQCILHCRCIYCFKLSLTGKQEDKECNKGDTCAVALREVDKTHVEIRLEGSFLARGTFEG